MIEITCLTWLISSISATIILCAGKWGWLEWWEVHGGQVCKFCLGFWLCLIQTFLIFLFYNQNIFDIAIPFAGAAITRKLYE